MSQPPSIVWFRLDLRVADNPALDAAVQRGNPVVPLFIWAPEEEGEWAPGAASRWWLHQSLTRLSADLARLGAPLVIRHGPALGVLESAARECGADAIFWNRRYEPAIRERDRGIRERLRSQGVTTKSFNSALLFEPWTVQTKTKMPFQVFTAFWKSCLAGANLQAPPALPHSLQAWPGKLASLPLAALELEPKRNWTAGMKAVWQPGEEGASEALRRFCEDAFTGYDTARNHPDTAGTSRLSPHLHFGEIGPRQIWRALRGHAAKKKLNPPDRGQFLAELGWREFAHHLLYHFPHTPAEPLRAAFARFPWREDNALLAAWQQGRTGYPFVDAGMRELWTTGWMHNRVRMVAASFLVKDLMLPWQAGARWFWDTLVDADLASNTLGWQWTAGCGADAAPFFRVFNPFTQGEKFDPDGTYVRRWVPELRHLPNRWIHRPWEAPAELVAAADLETGRTYPAPIVEHAAARTAVLDAYSRIRNPAPRPR